MAAIKYLVKNIQNRFFDSIVNNRLVYNTCWEDPRIDRKLLGIDSDSRIIMLTSAGCNALDYLLDDPAEIHAVDANPNQNALLQLKRALFQYGDYETLFQFFGRGFYPSANIFFQQHLRAALTPKAHQFWDKHINYFSRTTTQPSFYFRGHPAKLP
ncbi:MAG: DUF3419 family protein [Balneolaceae bacterium]|nr:DUF3419 family protein [Balneolaceae bacterium]